MAALSDLTVFVNRKLYETGIEIPFPKRDLHLRRADVEAARTLRGDDEWLGRALVERPPHRWHRRAGIDALDLPIQLEKRVA